MRTVLKLDSCCDTSPVWSRQATVVGRAVRPAGGITARDGVHAGPRRIVSANTSSRSWCRSRPGGPTDVVARLIAQSMSSRLGQTVLVENLVGAGGRLGAKAVAGATPDGYTLLLGGTNVNAIMGVVYKDLPFDPIASFAPIAAICVNSMALAVSPRVPAESFAQFVQYAKSNPGQAHLRRAARYLPPFRRRVLQGEDRHRHPVRPVQRRRARHHRPARRAHRHGAQCQIGAARPLQERQAAAARGDQQGALAGAAGHADHAGARRRPAFRPKSGSACWRPPARRRQSSARSMRRSTTASDRRRCAPAWPSSAWRRRSAPRRTSPPRSREQAHEWKTVIEATGVKVE